MTEVVDRPVHPFRYVLLKLASRCNINCTYCYWFRDSDVYRKPSLLPLEVERVFLEKLGRHVVDHSLDTFTVLLHGGEPLLFGKRRFVGLMDGLCRLEKETGCVLRLAVTTNGVLIDDEWARLLRIFGLRVTVSMDGPAAVNDRRRVDFHGDGTHERVLRGIDHLRDHGIEPNLLAVCNPQSDPEEVCHYFVDTLGVHRFDIMIPDAIHGDRPTSVADYYKKLFDLWLDDYAPRGVSIRYAEAVTMALFGRDSQCEAVGYGPIELVTMLTDGSLEPLDVLRIAGRGSTATQKSILTHTFQDVAQDPVWNAARRAALVLPPVCQACRLREPCGGGYLPHRWSDARGYENPSVYCEDLQAILDHAWDRISNEVDLVTESGKRMKLATAVSALATSTYGD